MTLANPFGAVLEFFHAFNNGDVDAAVTLYEPDAVMVAQPGEVISGAAAVREALSCFLNLKPTLTLEKSELVVAGDIALSVVRWTLEGVGPDGAQVRMEGTTSDVLRRQPDGRWLFVIDNPWGTAILGERPEEAR